MKKLWKIFWLLFVLVVIILAYIAFPGDSQIAQYPSSFITEFPDSGSYAIDSDSILESLDQDATDVFQRTNSSLETEPYEPKYLSPLSWTQSDYLDIASALHQYVWNEVVENWHLYSMGFFGDCRHEPFGFDVVSFTYFKAVESQRYAVHKIEIVPLSGYVNWGGGNEYPRPLFGWKSINLEKLNVTAGEALQIAEENGGQTARTKVINNCTIYVGISSNSKIWAVRYSRQGTSFIFEANVDPSTGDYKIVPGQ